MHILMIPGWLAGGGEALSASGVFFLEQARIMREFGGCRVNIFSPRIVSAFGEWRRRRRLPSRRGLEVSGEGGGEVWRDCRLRWLRGRRAAAAESARGFWRKYREKNGSPDVLWVQSARGNAAAAAQSLSAAGGVPYFVVEHSARFFSPFGFWERRRLRNLFSGAIFTAAVSDFLRKQMAKVCPDATVLHNPVAPVFFEPVSLPSLPSSAGGNDNEFVFHSTGRLEADKGHETVIAAFARFPDANCKLQIAGEGALLPKLRRLAKEKGIAERVEFFGARGRKDLAEDLRRANGYVSASKHETFNLSLAEALVSGLPCAATPTGVAAEIIGEENGALAGGFGEENVFQAMKEVRENRYDKQKITAAAREMFAPKKYADTLAALIKSGLPRRK